MRMTLMKILALATALCMALAAPAGAAGGLLGWLLGEPDETAEPASATVELALEPTAEPTIEPSPSPTFAAPPIVDAQVEDDGLLRVALRSLGTPAQLNLTFAGAYAVDAMPELRFDSYAHVALTAGDGHVYLSAGGVHIDLGEAVTFNRHRAGDGAENGIYIAESEKDTAYCGDLTVSAAEEGGLSALLEIGVEDYLLGVVGYEMSDSFPLEALKAQAVAARTYALRRKHRAGDARDYDVVDTTADQVFKGYDPAYANVAAAVEATRGVVGMVGGEFASCYYTASNGGQTALAGQIWGRDADDAILAMADDPYDLENPRSLQNDLTITPACDGSAALKGMLETALGERMAEAGYADGAWAFDGIEAIEPVNPRFEGSRMYDGLKFTLRAKALVAATAEPADEPASDAAGAQDAAPMIEFASDAGTAEPAVATTPGPAADASAAMPTAPDATLPALTPAPQVWTALDERFEVTLDVFGQLKPELKLGLNGGDYELVSVETTADEAGEPQAFTIIMRRFGHGVGMSQRGAQWMAGHYGKGWQEILAFYYPGMTVARVDWPARELTALDALPAGVGSALPEPTPKPTPAPLPALESGEYIARVSATLLNVRQKPSTEALVVDQLAQGRRVIVRGDADADGWVPIRTAELEGYVKAEYLEKE